MSDIKSDVIFEDLKKGDPVCFVRVLPITGIYELLDLNIVTVHDTYCTGVDTRTKQTHVISKQYAEEILFKDRTLALKYLDNKLDENIGDGK